MSIDLVEDQNIIIINENQSNNTPIIISNYNEDDKDKCAGELQEDNRENINCNMCVKDNIPIYHFKSLFSDKGTFMCNNCAVCECCIGCGRESGGSLCMYCRSDNN